MIAVWLAKFEHFITDRFISNFCFSHHPSQILSDDIVESTLVKRYVCFFNNYHLPLFKKNIKLSQNHNHIICQAFKEHQVSKHSTSFQTPYIFVSSTLIMHDPYPPFNLSIQICLFV